MRPPRFSARVCELLEQRILCAANILFAHATATLSQARFGMAATSVAGKAFFAGGNAGGVDYDNVDVYNARTGAWSVAHLSTQRSNLAATTADGKALFAGGETTSDRKKTGTVDVFDAASGRWSITTMRHARSFFGAATVHGLAIFAGNGVTATATADVLDARTGRWSTAFLPASLNFNSTAATAGHLAIFASGSSVLPYRTFADIFDGDTGKWSASRLPGEVFKPLSSASVGTKAFFADEPIDGIELATYDSITGTWSTQALPHARLDSVVASVGTKVLFAGGTIHGQNLDSIDVYDTATGGWSTLALSQPREAIAATAVGNQVIFAGGEQGSTASNTVDIFTDLTPSAVLSGGIAGDPASGSLTVTLLNTGDASLPPIASLNLYATTTRGVLASSSKLLASIKLAKTLRAGGTATLTLPVSTDALPPGSYHLLATVATTRHRVTPIASTTDPFTVKAQNTGTPLHGWPFAF